MAFTLPIGIRVAAGLLGTAIDRLGRLPGELPTLGVTLAGQVVKTSFRLRQEIAELATRGDDLLSGLTGGAQEHPAWATFDEDEDEVEVEDQVGKRPAGTLAGPFSATAPDEPAAEPIRGAATSARTATPAEATSPRRRPTPGTPGTPPRRTASATPPKPRRATRPEGAPGSVERRSDTARTPTAGTPTRRRTAAPKAVGTPTDAPGAAPGLDASTNRRAGPDGPAGSGHDARRNGSVPGPGPGPGLGLGTGDAYRPGIELIAGDHPFSVAELKERLSGLQVSAVRDLLTQEESGPNRAAYLTLLGNRLTTLDQQNQ